MNSGDRRSRHRWIEQDHHRHADDAGDRRGVANEVEIELFVERGVDRVGDGGKQQRISVRRRVHHGLGADIAAGARPVLRHEGLAEPLVQPLTDQARRDVDPAAGGKAGDDAHRPRRILVRRRKPREGRCGGNGAGRRYECTAVKFHDAPLRGANAIAIFVTEVGRSEPVPRMVEGSQNRACRIAISTGE